MQKSKNFQNKTSKSQFYLEKLYLYLQFMNLKVVLIIMIILYMIHLKLELIIDN